MSEQWMVYLPYSGSADLFDSEQEAVDYANNSIDEYLGDEWDDTVQDILVAKVTHVAVEERLHNKEDFTQDEWNDLSRGNTHWGFLSDYSMVPVLTESVKSGTLSA